MKRLMLVAFVAALVLTPTIPATAQGGGIQVTFSNAHFGAECWTILGMADDFYYGVIRADVEIFIPAGFTYTVDTTHFPDYNMPEGSSRHEEYTLDAPYRLSATDTPVNWPGWLWVPGDGEATLTYTVYNPAGRAIATGGIYGNCVTGEVYTFGGRVTGGR